MMDLTDIPEQWHVKRALEVAAAGGHTIRIVGTNLAPLHELQAAGNVLFRAVSRDGAVEVALTCPCGWLESKHEDCTCGPNALFQYREATVACEITVMACDPRPDDCPARFDSIAEVAARIRRMGDWEGLSLGNDARTLMDCALRQLGLSQDQGCTTIRVARTIANLDGCESIRVAHIAEAIQYVAYDPLRRR